MCQKVVPIALAIPQVPASPDPLFQISALENPVWDTDSHSVPSLTLACESQQRGPQRKSGVT